MAKRLRVFVTVKQTLLVWTAWQALQLRQHPSNLREKLVLIELDYEPKNTLKFTFKRSFIMPRSYLAQHADPLIVADVQRRDERCLRSGGVGTALVLLQCGALAEVMPIEMDQERVFQAWDIRDDWEDILQYFITSDRQFAPPLVSGLNIRHQRFTPNGVALQ